jgi:hypothetical protein
MTFKGKENTTDFTPAFCRLFSITDRQVVLNEEPHNITGSRFFHSSTLMPGLDLINNVSVPDFVYPLSNEERYFIGPENELF